MQGVPLFAVFYDPAMSVVTRKVSIDTRPGDSNETIIATLKNHRLPNEQIILVPLHQYKDVAIYLTSLGIKAIA